jgi:predicted phage-related endonuclease
MALTDKQRELRKGKFTGTDANAIMSGDPYRINDAYLKHTNDPRYVEPDFTEVWPVRLGEVTEALNLEFAAMKYGPITRQGEVVYGLGSLDWTCATLDGWLTQRNCPIEAKCVNGRSALEEVIARYQPQMHWQMMTTKAKECALSVIIGGNEPIVEFVPLNRQYARELWTRASAFWLCVKSKTPPVELPAVPPPPLAVKEYDMTDNQDWKTWAGTWLQAYGAAQTAKEREKQLKSLVPPDAKLCYGHGVIIIRNRAGAMRLQEQVK